MRWLLLLVLALPGAQAGVPFEIEIADARGDVSYADGRPSNATGADILSLVSRVVDGRVVQRVEMAAVPQAPADNVFVRSWYHNSTNGSWHVIDLEVRGDAPDPAQRFRPVRREGAFHDVTPIEAKYGLDGATWVFEFDAALVADATCFDPGVFAEHAPPRPSREPQGFDSVYLRERRCETAFEPVPPPPSVLPVVGMPSRTAPTVDAPGSAAPTPAPGVLALLAGLGLAVALRRARRAP